MKNIVTSDSYADLESIVINSLSSTSLLMQTTPSSFRRMASSTSTSLILCCLPCSRKNKAAEVTSNSNPKISLEKLAERVKAVYPQFCENDLYGLFPERKEVNALKLYQLFDEQNCLDIDFKEDLSVVFEGQYLSPEKLDGLMKEMGFPPAEEEVDGDSFARLRPQQGWAGVPGRLRGRDP